MSGPYKYTRIGHRYVVYDGRQGTAFLSDTGHINKLCTSVMCICHALTAAERVVNLLNMAILPGGIERDIVRLGPRDDANALFLGMEKCAQGWAVVAGSTDDPLLITDARRFQLGAEWKTRSGRQIEEMNDGIIGYAKQGGPMIRSRTSPRNMSDL